MVVMLHEHGVDGGQEAGPLLVEEEEDERIEAGPHQAHAGLDQPQRGETHGIHHKDYLEVNRPYHKQFQILTEAEENFVGLSFYKYKCAPWFLYILVLLEYCT